MVKTETVKVCCMIPNGIMLNLFKPGFDDGTGVKQTVRDGGLAAGIRLSGPARHADAPGGVTEVDAAWWAKWKEQNELNPFFVEGYIFEVKPEEEKAKPRPTT